MEEKYESNYDKKKILIVDDEKPIVEILTYNLHKEGYETIEAYDGEQAITLALTQKPDLILLDIMLPKVDGLTVCKRIRHTLTNVPILILSAKDEEIDKILGLELGADDYITKPFSVRELMARVKANLRKSEVIQDVEQVEEETEEDGNKIEVGELKLDLDKYEVKVRGEVIDLTLREFEVLKYLANQPGQVVTRETLLEKVWGYEYYGDIRTVDVTVRRIREKIEKDTSNPKILITKRSVGYYIAAR
ncbi:MAG: response regulator [Clostridia bacterium]|nr:response regulator [Clostridia bacterium]CDE83573.1 two component transcriptional regulator winged helix family [Clostridium sp. CAG:273]